MSIARAVLLCAWVATLGLAPVAQAQIVQITDDDDNDTEPDISGERITWISGSNTTGHDIDLWDGTSIVPLSSDGFNKGAPRISGSSVVWTSFSAGARQLYLWDGGSVATVPGSGGGVFTAPDIDGPNVVWAESPGGAVDGAGREVYLWDGSITTPLTGNIERDQQPAIAGNRIAWSGAVVDDKLQIFVREPDGTVLQLTDSTNNQVDVGVSSNYVAWSQAGSAQDVYVFDGETTLQLTSSPFGDRHTAVSDDYVVWERVFSSTHSELMFWDGTDIFQLDSPTDRNQTPRLDGSMLTWSGFDGSDWEIFRVDLTSAPILPEPGTGLLIAIGLVAGLRRRAGARRG